MSNIKIIEIVACLQCVNFNIDELRCYKYQKKIKDSYSIPDWCMLYSKEEYLIKNREDEK